MYLYSIFHSLYLSQVLENMKLFKYILTKPEKHQDAKFVLSIFNNGCVDFTLCMILIWTLSILVHNNVTAMNLQDGRISYEEFSAMMKAGTDWRKASRQYSRDRFNSLSQRLIQDGSLQLNNQ